MTRDALLTLLLGLAVLTACGPTPDTTVPVRLDLYFELLDNHRDDSKLEAALTLARRGPTPLGSEWELFFNFGRRIEPLDDGPVAIHHMNGDLFKLTPTASWTPLAVDEGLRVVFQAPFWIIKEDEAPAGAYLVRAGATPQPVEVTVAPFVERRQIHRNATDQVPVATPAWRYEKNRALHRLDPADVPPVVPTPRRLVEGNAELVIDASWQIRYGAGLESEATFLATAFASLLGTEPERSAGGEAGAKVILLALGDAGGPESYRLEATPESGIRIIGSDAAGVFYGVQSLRALVPVAAYDAAAPTVSIRETRIDDGPRFAYRGMHLDVSRNFHSKTSVKKLLDLMAFYKLNRFHFHLTDDEG